MKRAANMKKSVNYFTNTINNIRNFDYRQYTKTNILFFTFVLSNFFNAWMLRAFTVHNYFELRPIIADITFLVLVGAFAYLFKEGKKQYRYFLICNHIITNFYYFCFSRNKQNNI